MASTTAERTRRLRHKESAALPRLTPNVAMTPTDSLVREGRGSRVLQLLMRTSRAISTACLAAMRRAEHNPATKSTPKAIGLLPADWEYMTNVAAETRPHYWVRTLLGDQYR